MESSQETAMAETGGDGAMPAQPINVGEQIDKHEKALLKGDLSRLSNTERKNFYKSVCESIGLNPLTKPLEYIRLNGDLTLYANKSAAAQLRKNHGISIPRLDKETVEDLFIVTAYAEAPSGRVDTDEGGVDISRASGEALANARMKAITKAKRRVTLSICGLGFLDETEIDSIPADAKREVEVNEDGQIEREGNGYYVEFGGERHYVTQAGKSQLEKADEHLSGIGPDSLGNEIERVKNHLYSQWPKGQRQPVDALLNHHLERLKKKVNADDDTAGKASGASSGQSQAEAGDAPESNPGSDAEADTTEADADAAKEAADNIDPEEDEPEEFEDADGELPF